MSLRKTLVGILRSMGVSLAMGAILKILGVAWLWVIFIAGVVLIALSFLLSVPRTSNMLSHRCICRWLWETYIWRFYGPIYLIRKPVITFKPSGVCQKRDYTARMSLCGFVREKARKYLPIKLSFDTTLLCLKPAHGLGGLPISMPYSYAPGVLDIIIYEIGPFDYPFSLMHSLENRLATVSVDTSKDYHWKITGIRAYLNGVTKEHSLSAKGKHIANQVGSGQPQ